MFALALEGMTIHKLKEILPSYGITDDKTVRTIEGKFETLEGHPLPIVSVPQLLQRALGLSHKEAQEIGTRVKKDLSDRAGVGIEEGAELLTFYRGDTRGPAEIAEAGGLFGRDLAPITVEHARQIMRDWQSCTANEKLDRAQAWKAQTKGKTDIVPYVATGVESQKGGHEYEIQVPLTFKSTSEDTEFTPKLGCDVWPLESATIMAIKLHGGEAIFLTGIPAKFIVLRD